jgi:predicted transcriptional regulator
MAKQSSAKQTVEDIVREMPEDSSYDEILEQLLMNRMIERGLADVEAGRTISDDEMAKTIESWRDSSGRRNRAAGCGTFIST